MKTNRALTQQTKGFISRRKFIGAAGVATTFMIVKPSVLGRDGPSPNSKLNIAGIGIGGQGGWDVEAVKDENIVALADVDWDYAAKAFERYPNAKRYKDFREMLDKEKSIDAIVCGTPDHNHAI